MAVGERHWLADAHPVVCAAFGSNGKRGRKVSFAWQAFFLSEIRFFFISRSLQS